MWTIQPIARFVALYVLIPLSWSSATAQEAQASRVALKSGESTDLDVLYFVGNCKSILVSKPEVEILEGPPELSLSVREEMVLPRRQACSNKVSGGILVLKAADVSESKQARLTYRIKYKTKDGDRQRSNVYNVSLFP